MSHHLDREDRTRLAAGENNELPPPPKVSDADDQGDPEERFTPPDGAVDDDRSTDR